ncbi:MAG: EamA family transporter [Acidobacteria bacterium]|nr:EamA family transporter [Acidobacteriota bacterium]MBS1866735.1 EamA family transporter [Acidobacteriota bacterium]
MPSSSAAAPVRAPQTSSINHVAAKSPALTVFAFFCIYFIWGSTYLAIRYAVATIPPLYTAGFRHLIAGSILLIWALAKGARPTGKQIRASVIIGIFFFLIGHGTLHWAETRIPSGFASLIIASEPIWVFLMAALAEKKWRMNLPLMTGVVIGLVGVALLVGHDAFSSGSKMFVGSVAVLLGAISWSVGIVYSRRSHLSGNPLLLSALSLLSGSFLLLTTGTIAGEARGFSFAQVTMRSWLALAYLILFGSVVTFTAYNWLMEHYPPTFVATHTYVNPIVAVFLGWWFAGEKVTINVAIAAALVILAVFLVDRGMAKLQIDSNTAA